MSKGQWTVVGLLIVLASLEIIRSGAVQGFFQGFVGQFGVKSSQQNSEVYVNNAPASTATAHGVTSQSIKGMPSAGGGHPY